MAGRTVKLAVSAAAIAHAAASNCFIMMDQPLAVPPFTEGAVAQMRAHFLANLNINGTGANAASPGSVPALEQFNCPGGYDFDWVRDSALSMVALMRMLGSEVGWVGTAATISGDVVDKVLTAYSGWVQRIQGLSDTYDVHGEPKWEINAGKPYTNNWCRPQTDGPGLRAQALMAWAARSPAVKGKLWEMIKFDLDWLAQDDSITKDGCDLWEESEDSDLLWNRMTMRAALIKGAHFAKSMGDNQRAANYQNALDQFIKNPLDAHFSAGASVPFISECPTANTNSNCHRKGKDLNGAVILALIHSGWLENPGPSPATSPIETVVAQTVRAANEAFCSAYPVNRRDSDMGIPGVLYGRYVGDGYGGGNPWQLITAALATLLYQAAQEVARGAVMNNEQLTAWRTALNTDKFTGSAVDFVTAGDSVLIRLRQHIRDVDNWHLYEQIDKNTGVQFNAQDLTWSYAETLSALQERSVAIDGIYAMMQAQNAGAAQPPAAGAVQAAQPAQPAAAPAATEVGLKVRKK